MSIYTIKNMNHNKELPRSLQNALKENRFRKVMNLDPKNGDLNYKIGQWYWCGYWQRAYKVISKKFMDYNGHKRFKSVLVKWEDGKITTHCTSLDPRYDFKLYK